MWWQRADILIPGDLVFYANETGINHVAIYIGGGQVCHASNPTRGIIITNLYYRDPVCARRFFPNYINLDTPFNQNSLWKKEDPKRYRYECATMGCRTYNGFDINGLGFLKDGRGNIAPVTIIMPTLAMEAVEEYNYRKEKGVLNEGVDAYHIFMALLDRKITEARDMLIERYRWICQQNPSSAKFMYENGLMAGYDGKTVESAMKHGTLVIGQLGLAETLQILIGKRILNIVGKQIHSDTAAMWRCNHFLPENSKRQCWRKKWNWNDVRLLKRACILTILKTSATC